MAYQADIGSGQTLYIEQQGQQTTLRVSGDGQRQGVGVQTGAAKAPPRLLKLNGDLLLELGGPVYYAVGGGQLRSLESPPSLDGAEEVALNEVPDGSDEGVMKPMEPIKPLEPMKPLK